MNCKRGKCEKTKLKFGWLERTLSFSLPFLSLLETHHKEEIFIFWIFCTFISIVAVVVSCAYYYHSFLSSKNLNIIEKSENVERVAWSFERHSSIGPPRPKVASLDTPHFSSVGASLLSSFATKISIKTEYAYTIMEPLGVKCYRYYCWLCASY